VQVDLAPALVTDTWHAMGGQVDIAVLDGPASSLDAGRRLVDHLERAWSRFLPDSEISRLNRAGGEWVPIGPATRTLLGLMQEGHDASDGLFDPTVLGAVTAAGYDRSVTWPGPGRPMPRLDGHGAPGAAPGLGSLAIDHGRARIASGVGVDPGACGKGLAADMVVEALLEAGAAGVLVSVGGDVAAGGATPDDRGWGVRVTGPGDRVLALLALSGGGVATSATWRRRWQRADGTTAHHVVDPRTGSSSTGPIVQATVLAATAGWAEVMATTFLVGAQAAGPELATLPAVFVDSAGGVSLRGGVERWMQ